MNLDIIMVSPLQTLGATTVATMISRPSSLTRVAPVHPVTTWRGSSTSQVCGPTGSFPGLPVSFGSHMWLLNEAGKPGDEATVCVEIFHGGVIFAYFA